MLNRATSESIPAFEPPALQPHLLRIANHEARLDVLKSRAQLYAEAGRFVLQRLWVEIWQRADQRCARAPAAPTSKSTTARPRTACPRKSPHKKKKIQSPQCPPVKNANNINNIIMNAFPKQQKPKHKSPFGVSVNI